jgi:hypothetical protein
MCSTETVVAYSKVHFLESTERTLDKSYDIRTLE